MLLHSHSLPVSWLRLPCVHAVPSSCMLFPLPACSSPTLYVGLCLCIVLLPTCFPPIAQAPFSSPWNCHFTKATPIPWASPITAKPGSHSNSIEFCGRVNSFVELMVNKGTCRALFFDTLVISLGNQVADKGKTSLHIYPH